MQRFMRRGLLVAGILALFAPPAFARDASGAGKIGVIDLPDGGRIGSTALKPGRYQVQHVFHDGQHFLVVRERMDTGVIGSVPAGRNENEIARVPCRIVPSIVGNRISATALFLDEEADGLMRITAVHIKGEKNRHVVSIQPER